MVKVAEHCKPGGWKQEGHTPVCDWPDDYYVQWGSGGLVISKKPSGSYTTAFFEAFAPSGSDDGGFIRGEGETIEAAERAAFAQWEKEYTCQHRWGRRGYTNGGGICCNCGAFKSGVFPEIGELGDAFKPLDREDIEMIMMGGCAPRLDKVGRRNAYGRKIALKAKLAGIDLPEPPAELQDYMDPRLDAYMRECEDALVTYFVENCMEADPEQPALVDLTQSLAFRSLIEKARKQGLLPERGATPTM